ncbi:MAG: amino acid permease [candidate division Zixibacteria bacterium]|nr:amino acid permease [candidate division Zixibacteria bacterium]
MIVVGIVIGSGIFLTTGLMAKEIPSPTLLLLAWTLGGLHSIAGALTFAELGAAMPEAGGQYVYLREAYGRLVGFLFGWVSFLVYLTGILAALAVGFAEYFGYFFPALSTGRMLYETDFTLLGRPIHYGFSAGHVIAVLLILSISAINYLGVHFGKWVQNVSTIVKIGAVLALVVAGLLHTPSHTIDWTVSAGEAGVGMLFSGFGIALVSVIWTIAGWEEVSFIGGEVKRPERNLPRVLLIGVGSVTVLYVVVNYVYLRAIPVQEMAGVVRVGEIASNAIFGHAGTGFFAVAVMIAVLGSLNGTILVGPRVYYAMARDGLFFRSAASVHPRYLTPGAATLMQAAWATVLTVSGSHESLIAFVIFSSLMLWIAAAAAVFTLRKKYPDRPRPYKAWGYPYVPALFIVVSLGIMVNMLFETPVESLAGLGLSALGLPAYLMWRRNTR